MKESNQSLSFGLVVPKILLSGCALASKPVPPAAAPIPPTATPVPPTPTPLDENYGKVDPTTLPVEFQADIPGEVRTEGDGNLTAVGGGKVTQFTAAGKPIALVSEDMLLEEKEVFINTQDYYKTKVTFNYDVAVSFWLKPTQNAKLLVLTK